MKYKKEDILIKWYATIEQIKDDIVIVKLLEIYPIPSILSFNSYIPKKSFEQKDLELKNNFYIYFLKNKIEIEFLNKSENY
mgnify:CR=1 FL=1